ncbi:DNA repair protein RadA [Demequina sp. SYSU T00039]|uniref:DNA repair protein RadA n=1 Tax=Demequina lignilytica TaxID=3051663 RepID=A0AAW7M7T6_9MICO|nr:MULTISPECIES: DNA repair protein RadA [unclassified Demequina]MDN4477969.1 DNA repair protein RadA [Demequina sp. SYSU T00039-1]MDN4487878.1 DNA repair protein RadA [Demequina sp. SYSU T00039]MDN4490739.1 DNA repair protein RadA [Demequina sp. SYSU T00068]
MATSTRKSTPGYRCTECGWTAVKWVGRCGECQAWGTVVEAGAAPAGPATKATAVTTPATPLPRVDAAAARRTPTGVGELDRVLGGGFVPGAVVLLAGEPGVGKSTLLLDVAARAARDGGTVLYVSGEESAGQIRLRAERIGALEDQVLLAAETDLGAVLAHLDQAAPSLVMIDSIQTIASAQIDGTPGGVGQVREVSSALIQAAKTRGLPMVLVGHVTKDGSVAGPRIVEHLVDVVCQFEGDQHSPLRLLRALKNRFGSVDEVGCFQLVDSGIESVADPSGLFLSHESEPVPGTCPTITLDGKRPLPAEIQALVAPSALSNPRRATSGVDSSRVAMLLAVLHRRVGVALAADDVYVSTVGGARVIEPAADVALALALASARADRPVRAGWAAVGEVALSGAVRPVAATAQRVAEAARLGFTDVVVPAKVDAGRLAAGIRLHPVGSVAEAVALAIPGE